MSQPPAPPTAELAAIFALNGHADCGVTDVAAYLRSAAQDGKIDRQVALLLWRALEPNGGSEMRLVLQHRKRGKPIDRNARARLRRGAASRVEILLATPMKWEAAIAQVSEETGISRSELAAWLKDRRSVLKMGAARERIAALVAIGTPVETAHTTACKELGLSKAQTEGLRPIMHVDEMAAMLKAAASGLFGE